MSSLLCALKEYYVTFIIAPLVLEKDYAQKEALEEQKQKMQRSTFFFAAGEEF